jgi:hypothetical protein
MALLEPVYEALSRPTSRARPAAPKRRTRGLLGRLTAEQKTRAYSYDGDMKCGPSGS